MCAALGMPKFTEHLQSIPLWLHAIYLTVLLLSAIVISFNDALSVGWIVILWILIIGTSLPTVWLVYEFLAKRPSDYVYRLPPSLFALPLFDVALCGLIVTFALVDELPPLWVIVLLLLLLVTLALGFVSLLGFSSPPLAYNVRDDSLPLWLVPTMFLLTATVEYILLFTALQSQLNTGGIVCLSLIQLFVIICAVVTTAWIVLYYRKHHTLPVRTLKI